MNDKPEHFPVKISGIPEVDDRLQEVNVIEVKSPYDDSLLGTVATANDVVIEAALHNAERLFVARDGWLSVDQRIVILEGVIVLLRQQFEQLAMGAAEEGGKPLLDSRIEMRRCIDSFRICIDTLRNHSATPPPLGGNAASKHRVAVMQQEPVGPVLAISAFNHPLNLIAHQVGPAIASGCPVIIKPAQDTPLSCFRLVQIFHQAGLPKDWCQCLLPASITLSEAMVSDSRIAFFSFIGSAKVGWYLRSKLAAGTRCALEHGGVAPVIVAEDADVTKALPGLIKGAFYHAGQVCVSVQRIFAHMSIARDLANQIASQAITLKVGDPLSEQTEIGPLIRSREVDRVDLWVKEAVAGGGELLCGGDRLDYHCYAPTVIYNPPYDATVSTCEVFGPVVCVYPFDALDEAIEEANSLDVAFQAAVYSRNIDTALYLSSRLAASAVMVNDHTAFRVDWMPFAGLKHSGIGVGGIPHTMKDMQIEKMTVIHSDGIA